MHTALRAAPRTRVLTAVAAAAQVGPLRMATWQVSVVQMFFRPLWVVTLAFCLIFAF